MKNTNSILIAVIVISLSGSVFAQLPQSEIIDVGNRVRLEYRDFETKDNVWRFRNLVSVKLPFKVTRFDFQPYISEEFFINLGEDNVNQNRLSSGFSWKLWKNITASVYYMWKTNKTNGSWVNTNVIGTQFRWLF